MKKQLFAATIVFLLLCSVFVFRASALNITGVFQFESTPSDSKAAEKLAGSFSISALESHNVFRDPSLTDPTFYTFTIDNQCQSATIIGIYLYFPRATYPRSDNSASMSDRSTQVPQDILDLFTPSLSYVATPGIPYGVPSGGSIEFYAGESPGNIVDGFENGSLRVGILVTGFKGDETATFVNRVPDAGSTAILLFASLLAVEVVRRKCRA